MQKCLMIAGMHRSGTSLISSILQKAGLFVGDELMGASEGNEKGHFENIDFYKFQIKALESLSLDIDGWDLQAIEKLNDTLDKEAMEIIRKNNKEEWGWKEPRTTLFLNYWENKIPNMKYLFVYRDPWDVVDSIYRRGSDPKIIADPMLAFKVWDFYNREIIKAFKKHKDESILIHIDDIIKDIPGLIKELNTRFGFHLNASAVGDIFDKSIYTSSENNQIYKWLTEQAFPETITTLNELRNLSGKELVDNKLDDRLLEKLTAQLITEWAQKIQLNNFKNELKRREYEMNLMKESKFWKLRMFWQRIKGKKN